MKLSARTRPFLVAPALLSAVLAGGAVRRAQDTCGPFTDVSALFCPYVLEAYYTGITAGTSATTFSPDLPITRGQAAVFVTKSLNQALARGSRRAALGQWWVTGPDALAVSRFGVGEAPNVACDGTDVWVPLIGGFVSRYRGSDGRFLESWTTPGTAGAALIAMGRVFVLGSPKSLFMIDPSQAAGAATSVASNLPDDPHSLAFDGSRIWMTNSFGSISIVTPASAPPWAVTTVTEGFTFTNGILFDGANVWITDQGPGALLKLDANGSVLQTIPIGRLPARPVFDGQNIWVPDTASATITVVQAASGTVVATLSGNGLAGPWAAAFDGERVLVTNVDGSSVSLWRAADLAPLGSVATGANSMPGSACSDGINFWIALSGTGQLARF